MGSSRAQLHVIQTAIFTDLFPELTLVIFVALSRRSREHFCPYE